MLVMPPRPRKTWTDHKSPECEYAHSSGLLDCSRLESLRGEPLVNGDQNSDPGFGRESKLDHR